MNSEQSTVVYGLGPPGALVSDSAMFRQNAQVQNVDARHATFFEIQGNQYNFAITQGMPRINIWPVRHAKLLLL